MGFDFDTVGYKMIVLHEVDEVGCGTFQNCWYQQMAVIYLL